MRRDLSMRAFAAAILSLAVAACGAPSGDDKPLDELALRDETIAKKIAESQVRRPGQRNCDAATLDDQGERLYGKQNLIQIDASMLATIISDHVFFLESRNYPGQDFYSETFHANGKWQKYFFDPNSEVPWRDKPFKVDGSWILESGKLCVYIPRFPKICRFLFKSENRYYYINQIDNTLKCSGFVMQGKIRNIQIQEDVRNAKH